MLKKVRKSHAITPNSYLSIKPSTLMTRCDFLIYLYIGDFSHDRYQSFPHVITCVLTVHLLHSFLIFMVYHHLSYRLPVPFR